MVRFNGSYALGRLLPVLWLGLGLGGCSVVSERPLFDPTISPSHALAEGLWALSGPGCDVVPNPAGALPSCAVPVTIQGGQMSWDTVKALTRAYGPVAQGMAGVPLPKTSAYVLVDGEPQIIELLNGATNNMLPSPASGSLPPKPLKPGYLALRSLELDRSGRVVRGAIWPIACPLGGQLPAGLTIVGGQCLASELEAVRRQGQVPPLMQSAFLTWISSRPDPH